MKAPMGNVSENMIKVAGNYANILNSNSQTKINATSPDYIATMGDMNMAIALNRHGPNKLYMHIMAAAFDPVYGREFSLAQSEEKPATRFPLAEFYRPNERSEKVHFYVVDQQVPNINPTQTQVNVPNRKNKQSKYKPKYGNYGTRDYNPKSYGVTQDEMSRVFRKLRESAKTVYIPSTTENETEEDSELPYEGVTAKVIPFKRSKRSEPQNDLETILDEAA